MVSLIHKYLRSGILNHGMFEASNEGTPQGGPLSPLPSNIMLNELNKELPRRGHLFVRYADDSMIFCRSKSAFELCVHPKSKVKMKLRLKELTGRSNGMGNERRKQKLKEYIRGWIGYYHLANMKRLLLETDEWLRLRIRMCIWKSWKKTKARISNLIRCVIPKRKAREWGYTRLEYCRQLDNTQFYD